eukprot:IDg6580t1
MAVDGCRCSDPAPRKPNKTTRQQQIVTLMPLNTLTQAHESKETQKWQQVDRKPLYVQAVPHFGGEVEEQYIVYKVATNIYGTREAPRLAVRQDTNAYFQTSEGTQRLIDVLQMLDAKSAPTQYIYKLDLRQRDDIESIWTAKQPRMSSAVENFSKGSGFFRMHAYPSVNHGSAGAALTFPLVVDVAEDQYIGHLYLCFGVHCSKYESI